MRALKDLTRKEIRTIAKQYSRTDVLLSAKYFSKQFDISTGTFYNVLEKAVIEHIVTLDEAKLINNKAAINAWRAKAS